ncbi:MAG: ABC transporter permease [Planctomycetota bacterium]
MNRLGLAAKSAGHHWRSHLGVVLGMAIGTAVLVGALVVGDSVQASLKKQALTRIGKIDQVLVSHDRYFREALASELADENAGRRVVPVVRLGAVGSKPGGTHRANEVLVYGIDGRFAELGNSRFDGLLPEAREVLLNPELARQLEVAVGDTVLLRVEQPSGMPRDLVLATAEDVATALRVEVKGIVPAEDFGHFALEANQVPPLNAFVNLTWLQSQIDRKDRVNGLLVSQSGHDPWTSQRLDEALAEHWTLEDGELELVQSWRNETEVRSERVFLDAPIEERARESQLSPIGILTYFVNEIRSGERATPYSMVTGMGALTEEVARSQFWDQLFEPPLSPGQIVINEWLAEDLDAKVGTELTVKYFDIGPDRRLVEKERSFQVAKVVPMEGYAADRGLMPDFPGLADQENCRDWEPGIPIDLEDIRDKDEAYWDEYRGTPKAFLPLETAQELWSNRFGSLTAIRFESSKSAIEDWVTSEIEPSMLGLFFEDLRAMALRSGTATTDFGGLFLGLSSFLLVAAFLLTALLFIFGIEQRAPQIGLLLSTGWRSGQVKLLLLSEGLVLAVIGAALGTGAAIVYTDQVLGALSTVWEDAVARADIALALSPVTLIGGAAASILVALGALWLTVRRLVKHSAVELLGSRSGIARTEKTFSKSRSRAYAVLAAVCVLGAIGIVVWVGPGRGAQAAGAFFGAGGLVLVGGLFGSRLLLARWERQATPESETVARLGLRNSTRRPGRSLATVVLLASGTFLVVAIGVNRLGAPKDPSKRSSGTGGFTLLGRSTLGVLHELGSKEATEAYALPEGLIATEDVVGFRVRDGDEASCLNLNQTQRPRLLGVDPDSLASRESFTFADHLEAEGKNPWTLLSEDMGGAVPAIGDAASVQWALHKSVGDSITYLDERGRELEVVIVGTVANSILQGNLVIASSRFEEKFPSESGQRFFLIDVPEERAESVSEELTRGLQDLGLEIVPTVVRLEAFNSVQNTYLVIFQMLGGLGLLLGAAGLGTVVLRNVLERRSELALVRAVGFRKSAVRWLVWSEHGALLSMGLLSGILAALIAVFPALIDPGTDDPIGPGGLLILAVATSGALWVGAATWLALRGPLLQALRSE